MQKEFTGVSASSDVDEEEEEIEFDENDVEPARIIRSKEGELTELNGKIQETCCSMWRTRSLPINLI